MSMPPERSALSLGKELPGYAVKIREFMKAAALTEPQLGAALNPKRKRGAVAQWRSGVRRPRTENFLALAELANKLNLPEFAKEFLGYLEERKSDRQKEADEAEALCYLERNESEAATGNELARYLLDLSRRDPKEFAKEQTKRIIEARQTLDNGAFSAKLWEITDEMHHARKLFQGRQVRLYRRIRNLRLRYERMEPLDTALAKADQAQKGKVAQILDQMEVDARAGKEFGRQQRQELGRKLRETFTAPMNALNAQTKVLARLIAVESNLANLETAWEKGEPVDTLIDQIERALEVGREPKEAKEQKKDAGEK